MSDSNRSVSQGGMRYYPVFLDLRDRLTVVVGGGRVALEKVEGLIEAGARVRLIAPELSLRLAVLSRHPLVEHRARSYEAGDLEDARLVFAERLGDLVSEALMIESEARGIPLNVQDDLRFCTFAAPSLVRRGDLTVAISTAGRAPVLAVRVRQMLDALLGDHLGRFLEIAKGLRAPILDRFPPFATRRELWYRWLDSGVMAALADGDEAGAASTVREVFGLAMSPTAAAGPIESRASESGAELRRVVD